MPEIILMAAGVCCVLYYVVIVLHAGKQAIFARFWLTLGIFLLSARIWWRMLMFLPLWGKWLLAGMILVAGVLFVITQVCIILGMQQKTVSGLSYIIVLGAGVNGTVPSRSLLRRIEKAAEYLQANPDTKAILSGGQGIREDITEAAAMKQCLLERGIEEERLILEGESTNTWENMKYSQQFLDIERDAAAVVTNNFHVFRSMAIGKKLGYQELYGLPAASDGVLQANYLVREFFALIKDKITGNI